ncbi:hypothetical protein PR048_005893 [Dryococelus australis]|uniref:Uncharacterized protein n=1 Tax=Dryococelus australis TaxID=614101 RepID=A0ABQ9IA17_9NEOP|nr:hypothetical protein PR048_005893 [Dryococelus australis]
MVMHNGNEVPENWKNKNMAGIDWLYAFRKLHSNLSLKTPEPCSLSRVTAFNNHNVSLFSDNLETVLKRGPPLSDDEMGTFTVQNPKKFSAPKGVKQLNKATSGEKGTLVTTCCIISASEVALPPVMVFPQVHFK